VLLEVSRGLAKPLTGLANTFEEYLNQETKPSSSKPASPQPAGPMTWVEPVFDGEASQYPYHFMPYASQSLYDGSLAHLPWLQEMPDPMTSGMWCSWVEINAKKAEELGIHQGDVIEIASTQGSVRAPVFLNPGIAPDAVAMPVGNGHSNFTRYATNRGVNPISILAPAMIAETGALAWSATRVKITRISGPDQSLILFAGATRERPEEMHGR